MAALVIKNLPPDLHRRLKEDAALHRRSMTRQAILLPEQGLHRAHAIPPVKPFKGRFPLTHEFMATARREGRS